MTRPQEETRASGGPDPDLIRTEAERLVAAGLAAVSMAADRIGAPTRERGGAAAAGFDALGDLLFGPSGHRRHSVANESPECCRCPVCRAIAAARRPSPTFAERLASGVGFVAEGAARVMRGVAGAAGPAGTTTATRPAPSQPPQPALAWPEPDRRAEPDPWAAATAELPAPPEPPAPAESPAPAEAPSTVATPPPAKKTAKKAVRKAVKKAAAKKAPARKAPARPKKTTGNADQ